MRLVEGGPLDYLTLDYLAEVTMSILQKQRKAHPDLGYARDFPPLIARIRERIRDKNIRVIANAGGVNPIACAREVRRLAPDLKVAVVLGDDILDRIDELIAAGHELRNMDTNEPIATIRRHDPERKRLYWRVPVGRSFSDRRKRGHYRTLRRRRPRGRAHDS